MKNEINDYYEPTIKTSRTTTRNTNYYQLDYANELTKLNVEKQQLISFLEDKIKEYRLNKELCRGEMYQFHKGKEEVCQMVLDFVRGGKDE